MQDDSLRLEAKSFAMLCCVSVSVSAFLIIGILLSPAGIAKVTETQIQYLLMVNNVQLGDCKSIRNL